MGGGTYQSRDLGPMVFRSSERAVSVLRQQLEPVVVLLECPYPRANI